MNLTQCIKAGSRDKRPGYSISFHYDADIVEAIKKQIPHTEREWNEDTKTWWVSEEYEYILTDLFSNFYAL